MLHRHMRRTFLLLLVALPCLLSAQSSLLIRGRVLDRKTHEGLPYATVALLDATGKPLSGAMTDEAGRFQWSGPRSDTFHVRVQYVGFQTLDTLLVVAGGKASSELALWLEPQASELREITIRAERSANAVYLDKQTFDAAKLGNTTGGTGLDVLQRLPAVTINAEGKILVRGNAEFLVTVNGKFTHLAPADVLAQLPANMIEAIEVIASPSASADADGKAGIINIITKKNAAPGKGLLANAQWSATNRYGGDFAFYHTRKRFSSFLTANYRRYDIGGHRKGEIRTLHQDTVTYSPSMGERPTSERLYGIRAGTNYAISKAASLHAALYYGYRQNDRIANLNYRQYASAEQPLNLYQAFAEDALERTFYNQNLFVRTGSFFTANLDFTQHFRDNSKLSLAGIYEYSVLGGPLRNQDNDRPGGALLLQERSDERSPLDAWRLQADYSRSLSEAVTVETGLQARAVHHRGVFDFERLNIATNQWVKDPEFNDALNLRQSIYAAYAQLHGRYRRLQWRAGLRGEQMFRTLTHARGPEPVVLNQFDLFPSLQTLWKLNEAQEVKIGYAKRIDRPTTKALSPFKNHRHSEAIWVGDPNLQPEITHTAELTYVRRHRKGNLTLTAYHSRTSNLIFRVNDEYNRIILLTISTNAGNSRSTGMEMATDWQAAQWLSLYLSSNVYLFQITGIEIGVADYAQSFNYNLNANLNFKITPKWRLQWNTTYVSRTATAQGFDTDLLLSNLSARFIISENWSADLLFQNIFDTNRQTITTRGPRFYSSTEYGKYDRIVQLSVGYRFNDKAKNAKNIKTEYGEKDF